MHTTLSREVKPSNQMDIINEFEHHTSLNCETGVMRNLLNHAGFKISEDLLFGIGSGLYFIHFPFLKMGPIEPLTAYRYTPGSILKSASKLLNIELELHTFKNATQAMTALDQHINEGKIVGVTGDIFYFETYPQFIDFHFNNHNLVVYGRKGNEYLVSDPIVEEKITITRDKMHKARFTDSSDNPKGRMYWVKNSPKSEPNLEAAIIKGAKVTCNRMLNPFFPLGGCKGMKYLAKCIDKYPKKKSQEFASKHLINMIRHQEIVSSGSGYRKQFAYFLIEAADVTGQNLFKELGTEMKENIAGLWRDHAVKMARCSREDVTQIPEQYHALADNLRIIADKEKDFFQRLKSNISKL